MSTWVAPVLIAGLILLATALIVDLWPRGKRLPPWAWLVLAAALLLCALALGCP